MAGLVLIVSLLMVKEVCLRWCGGLRGAELIGTEERSGGSGAMVQGWMAQVCVASGWDCGVSVV